MPDRIARVEALRVAATRDYVATAGLRAPVHACRGGGGRAGRGREPAGSQRRAPPVRLPHARRDAAGQDHHRGGPGGLGRGALAPHPAREPGAGGGPAGAPALGQDPLAIEAHWDRLYHSMRLRGHNTGFMMEALAGVDIALWDLAGKALGQPVYRLLGGPFRHSGDGPPRGALLRLRRAGQHAGGASGCRKPAYRQRVHGDEALHRARQPGAGSAAGGDHRRGAPRSRRNLLVDAHGCYDARSVVPAARRMQEAGVRWLEDPLPPEDVEGYAALCAAMEMPIASGETECNRWQFHDKLERRASDVILPDICRAGGISEGRRSPSWPISITCRGARTSASARGCTWRPRCTWPRPRPISCCASIPTRSRANPLGRSTPAKAGALRGGLPVRAGRAGLGHRFRRGGVGEPYCLSAAAARAKSENQPQLPQTRGRTRCTNQS